MGPRISTQWSLRANQIREDRNRKLVGTRARLNAELQGLRLDPKKIEAILNSPVTDLVRMLNTGQTSSYELTLIFAVRACTVGLENCWITEDNFDEAFRMAREYDGVRKQTRLANRTIEAENADGLPELFGVPVSIKDSIDIKGMASTIGTAARYDWKQQEDGLIMKTLKKSGIIPFVKSNVPQLAMTFESVNFVWGRATNPWDNGRAVGGSSGGEAALVAGRCSPLGVGSDIGGSIRIPSEFCGVYSLKPSSFRFSPRGHTFFERSIGGNIHIPLTMGPIGKSTEDLALFLKVVCDEKNYTRESMDPYVRTLPFNVKMYSNLPPKMRIGYFDSLDILPSTIASKRAIAMVKTELERLGHEFVRVTIPQVDEVIGSFYEYIAAEGNLKGYYQILEGEEMIREYRTVSGVFALPNWLINCLSCVTLSVIQIVKKSKPRLGFIMERSLEKSAYELFQLSHRHILLKREFIAMWRSQHLDVLICPGFGAQAVRHGYSEDTTLAACYTFIWNMLETPTGNLPITKVQPDEEIYHRTFNDSIDEKLSDNVKGSAGLPVGIQVVGLPNEDEKVLGVMNLIEKLFPFYRQNAFAK